jgi:hypothetical protein
MLISMIRTNLSKTPCDLSIVLLLYSEGLGLYTSGISMRSLTKEGRKLVIVINAGI